MRKVSEYHQHAGECRGLAAMMPSGDQRDQLLAMAETWDRLADERQRALHTSEIATFGQDDATG